MFGNHRVRGIAVFIAVAALPASLAGAATAGGPIRTPAGSPSAAEFVDGDVVVGYAEGTTAAQRAQIERELVVRPGKTIGGGTHVLKVAKGNVEKAVAQLKKHAAVQYAEPNYVYRAAGTPNDPSFGQLWGLLNSGQAVGGTTGTSGADVDAREAWDVSTGSAKIVVGVIDTGIDYTHRDLAANVWSNPGGVGGCAAGTRGYNAFAGSCDPMDDNNHGTHVAGTIGAVGNNGTGVTGINWDVSLMGLKFMNSDGFGLLTDAVLAIDWAIQAKQAGVNVRVLSNSWGCYCFSQALLDVIKKAAAHDILIVAAAGNDAADNDATPFYPASYDVANVISVAATSETDVLASYSNRGARSVDLGAPGSNILSTVRGNAYAYYYGTSMAAPHVSGVAALLLSACSLTTAGVRSAMLANGDARASLAGKTVTGGRLNARKALATCAQKPPVNSTAPSISGTPAEGRTLTAATGAWTSAAAPTYAYQWRRCNSAGASCTNVVGATAQSYTLAAADVGYTIRIVVTAKNSAGSTAATSNATPVVAPAPPTMTAPTAVFQAQTAVTVSWARSGATAIASYDVRYRSAPYSADFGAVVTWKSATTAGTAVYGGLAGYTYCFSARSRTAAGLISAWSTEKCTAVPLDERSLAAQGTWSRLTSTGYYLDTFTRSTSSGAALVRSTVQTKRIALVVTKCPTCGVVNVYWNTTLLQQVNLYASTTLKKQTVALPPLSAVQTGTVKITVVSSGKPIEIDGLGLSRT